MPHGNKLNIYNGKVGYKSGIKHVTGHPVNHKGEEGN